VQIPDFGDVLVPLITPFNDNEAVNYDRLAELATWALDTGRGDALVVTGTTGEFPTLSDSERVQSWKIVKEACGDRAPVVAGSGAASTRDSIRLTAEAEKIGADMVMIVGPYYQKTTQEGIRRHYVDVAESTNLPVMIYNIPLFTGVNVEPDTVRRLMDIENIVAIKEEAGINPVQSTQLINLARGRDDFVIIDGDDMMAFPLVAQGAVAIVSGGAQIVGAQLKQMVAACKRGEMITARDLFLDMFPIFEAFGGKGRINPIPGVRRGIQLCGLEIGEARRPLVPFDVDETENLHRELSRLGIL
jgi:4-hydroxy-tetrahydrodipicolinate synthase